MGFIIVFLVSITTSVLLFLFLRSKIYEGDEEFKSLCNKAFIAGLLSTLGVILFSAIAVILLAISHLSDTHHILYIILRVFIVFALSEEFCKFMFFKRFMQKNPYPQSWMSLVVFMTLVGTGFGVAENLVLSLSVNVGIMVVRALTAGHVGYGFVMGWFYGKYKKTNDKKYAALSFLIPFLIHGFYDLSLNEEMFEISDVFAFVAVSLAFVDTILLILAVRFFIKRRHDNTYMLPIDN